MPILLAAFCSTSSVPEEIERSLIKDRVHAGLEQARVAGKLRIQADGAATIANQERLYNVATVVEWLKAEAGEQHQLADIFERVSFQSVARHSKRGKDGSAQRIPAHPEGPFFMGEYHSAQLEKATRLNEQANEVFEQGNGAEAYGRQC